VDDFDKFVKKLSDHNIEYDIQSDYDGYLVCVDVGDKTLCYGFKCDGSLDEVGVI
jgi:hypothetical protein